LARGATRPAAAHLRRAGGVVVVREPDRLCDRPRVLRSRVRLPAPPLSAAALSQHARVRTTRAREPAGSGRTRAAMSKGAVHRATVRIPATHPALPGHFPGRPIVPGVVLLQCVLDEAERWLGKALDVRKVPPG